jgi:hypothetical protein
MLHSVVVILKSLLCIEGRVDIDTFNLPGMTTFKRFESKEVIAMYQQIVEYVSGPTTRRMVR